MLINNESSLIVCLVTFQNQQANKTPFSFEIELCDKCLVCLFNRLAVRCYRINTFFAYVYHLAFALFLLFQV